MIRKTQYRERQTKSRQERDEPFSCYSLIYSSLLLMMLGAVVDDMFSLMLIVFKYWMTKFVLWIYLLFMIKSCRVDQSQVYRDLYMKNICLLTVRIEFLRKFTYFRLNGQQDEIKIEKEKEKYVCSDFSTFACSLSYHRFECISFHCLLSIQNHP